MTTRYKSGKVTVTVDDGLDRWLRSLLTAAEKKSVALLEAKAEKLASEARTAWYGPNGVERETGKSGDIRVVTTFDQGRGVVTVSIGSTDIRTAGKTGKPVPVYVHRPRSTSTVMKQVDRRTWYATPEIRRGPIRVGDQIYKPSKGARVAESSLRYFVHEASARAGDGKYLLTELVRKPARVLVKDVARELSKQIPKAAA